MKKKLILNTGSSLLLQIITVLCGLVLPRMYLQQYGSEVNGLVQSITQFLGVISFLELGVGQVIQSALYKPLAEHDNLNISSVVASGGKFFKRIAHILFVYVIVLMLLYPFIIEQDFDWLYTATLIGAMSISYFAQYYFGVVDRLLLSADQRGYIQYASQIITLILNTIACVVLMNLGMSIQFVRLISSLVFLVRPFAIRLYINKHYCVDRYVKFSGEPIKQKWNGIAQHVSAFILNGTDTIVLTMLSTLQNVSIYSVYHMIIYGIHQLYQSATAGLHAIVGELWAKQDLERLNRVYGYIEMALHFSTVFLFSCTGILAIPFVSVYTSGITDADYIQPVFAVLLTLAHASQCLKTTYNMVILGGGHYKQTQRCHIISALLNLVISVVTVHFWGLIGVAIGTVVSMFYQLVWMAIYDSKNLIKWPIRNFIKQMVVDIATVILIYFATSWIQLAGNNYFAWFVMAVQVAVIAFIITAVMAMLFYGKKLMPLYHGFVRRKVNK